MPVFPYRSPPIPRLLLLTKLSSDYGKIKDISSAVSVNVTLGCTEILRDKNKIEDIDGSVSI